MQVIQHFLANGQVHDGVVALIAAVGVDYHAYQASADQGAWLKGFNIKVAAIRYVAAFVGGYLLGQVV